MGKKNFKVKIILGLLVACTLGMILFTQTTKAEAVKNIRPQLLYRLKRIDSTVVQRSVIGQKYIYAVQKVHENTVIHRARKPKKGKNVVFPYNSKLILKNFGHTQTWVYSGKGNWLVGCTPVKNGNIYWDTEIAQVKFPKKGTKTYTSVKRLPHLTDLRYATDMPQDQYTTDVKRAEAAISPNHRWLLIASIDYANNGHFALYNLKQINSQLEEAAHKTDKAVSLKDIEPITAFHINCFFGRNSQSQLTSCQEFDIDNDKNLYISSETAPNGKISKFPRQVVKISWGTTNPKKWIRYRVSTPDWNHQSTELEGVEIANHNLHLTTGFHCLKPTPKKKRKKLKPGNIVWSSTESRIFCLRHLVK